VDNATYDEVGRLTSLRYPAGGNLLRTQAYYPWNLNQANGGQLKAIKVDGASNLMHLAYTSYDSFGNLTTWAGDSFTYDAQNRLTNAYAVPYAYDSAGNLTQFEANPVHGGYDTFPRHAVKKLGGSVRYTYDANGNMTTRYNPATGSTQTLTWDAENHLSGVVAPGLTESYRYDESGQRVQKTSNGGSLTLIDGLYEVGHDVVWVEDSTPTGAVLTGDEAWQWTNSSPAPVTGNVAHASTINAGTHQHYFYNASQTLTVGENDSLYTYVYLDPNNPPSQVMLQWHAASTGWAHRAYWGTSQVPWGVENTASRRYMGSLPATGGWVRLEVPASLVGLGGQTINGMAFTLYGGRAWWDRAGKVLSTREYFFNGAQGAPHIATRQGNALYYLHSDHLGSIRFATEANGDRYGDLLDYTPYGYDNYSSELPTDYNFTGQKKDGTGLLYYGARYYDPQIGTFISPDTLVPDSTHVFDYNRYMYARGNPLKYNDPTGHCATTEPSTSDQSAHSEWAECWQYANTIWAQWDKTDYWNQMWPRGKEHFIKNVATTPIPASYFKGEFMKYMNSPAYKSWAAQAPSRPGHDPSCPECAGVYAAAAAPCNTWDCPAIVLDLASLGSSIAQTGAAACTATGVGAPMCGPATAYLTYIDFGLNTTSIIYEGNKFIQGDSTAMDLSVTLADGAVKPVAEVLGAGASATPGVGVAYDALMLGYDVFIDPFVHTPGQAKIAR